MRERMHALTTPEEVDHFVHSHPIAAIFKAGTCHKTMQGWGNLERMLRDRRQIPVGIIRVVEHRPASNHLAEITGITHHSPQVILFRDGQAIFDLDNWDITLEKLEPLFFEHLSDVKIEPSQNGANSNLEPYKRLLDAYLGGAVGEAQFQWTYLNMFREDASLRSQEEFALLNSLFDNPDQGIASASGRAGNLEHHIHPAVILQHEQQNPPDLPLRERAAALREKLEALEASVGERG
jgi:bacillithiol system protein YtxJ